MASLGQQRVGLGQAGAGLGQEHIALDPLPCAFGSQGRT